jgi:DNA-binding IclR family transcriptional regulator
MKNSPTEAASGSVAFEKGLVLFNRILIDRGETLLAELAADLELPRSTLYRLTGALERAGLISRLTRGRYDIALPLAERVNGVSANKQLARLCRPALGKLAKACEATAHLGVMENDMVTYLVKVNAGGLHSAASFTRENAQLEAYCSAIGKVLLAWLPAEARARYLSGGPFVAMTSRTITDPAKLANCLKMVRSKKFARDDGEIANDLYCLAVPLRTSRPMTLAISISVPRLASRHFDDAIYLKKLRACADALSIRLGSGLIL